MREGSPSLTAQRVAACRLTFERLAVPYGEPAADEALARDVATRVPDQPSEPMARYLRARTAFFDRVVTNAIERGVSQVVMLGAGYDGRSLRYAQPAVRWWEVDHPDTQADKLARLDRLGIAAGHIAFLGHDLEGGGLAAALADSGFEPDAPSQLCCEGLTVYLRPGSVELLLSELRSLATPGTRLAISLSTSRGEETSDRRRRFQAAVAALGEPAMTALTAEDARSLFTRSRWRPVATSERSQRAGFVVAAPVWSTTPPDGLASIGRIAGFMERTLDRSDGEGLAVHLEDTYGVPVTRSRELDLGVHRVERTDGSTWIARVFPTVRPIEATRGDAELLSWLEAARFPAERCAADDPVSIHDGHGVLVTELVPGRTSSMTGPAFELLGQLLGRLHAMDAGCSAARRPGGAWHHLAPDSSPQGELRAVRTLFHDARHRVPADQRDLYQGLAGDLRILSDGRDLPHVVVHPDFVPRNVIRARDVAPVVIDWAGAGWGPRIISLGCLLWAASARGKVNTEAVVSGYRKCITLEPAELEELVPAMSLRPLVLACWNFATGRDTLPAISQWWDTERRRIEVASKTVRAELDSSIGHTGRATPSTVAPPKPSTGPGPAVM
ncbi:MAG: SAM-dependent methyltransferase [Acidimicrobiales bacterium]